MDETLIAAAKAAGIIDVDLLKILDPSEEPAELRIARFKRQSPHWFTRPAGPDVRGLSAAEYRAEKARVVDQGYRNHVADVRAAELRQIEARFAARGK